MYEELRGYAGNYENLVLIALERVWGQESRVHPGTPIA